MIGNGGVYRHTLQGDGQGSRQRFFRTVRKTCQKGNGMGTRFQFKEGDGYGKAQSIGAAQLLDRLLGMGGE